MSAKHPQAAATGVITGGETSLDTRNANNKKLKKGGILLIATLLLFGIAGLWVWNNHKTTQLPVSQSKKATIVLATPDNYSSVAASTNAKIQAASSTKEKATLYDQMSVNAQIAQNYTDALQFANSAEQLEPTAARAASLGLLYEQTNNWQTAVTWLQKAVDATPKTDNPNINNVYNTYVGQLNDAKSHL